MTVEDSIATYLPREVVYFDGTSAILPQDYVLKEGNLRLFVPKSKVDDVANAMKDVGFHDEKPEFYQGEKYSLVMRIYNIWDLHVRIHPDGFIDSHFEVSREYASFNYETMPSVYEPFEFYRTAYNKFHIFDAVAKKWVKEVRNNYLVTLNPPRALTAWRRSVIAGVLAGIGFIAYALSRLGEVSEN